jgi:ferredoxin
MESGVIFDIKKFSIHDGPGIRTTVFMKGCPLSCWWCHNPESQLVSREKLYAVSRCIGCLECIAVCPENAIRSKEPGLFTAPDRCMACGSCADACLAEACEMAGRELTVNQVLDEIEKDTAFHDESFVYKKGFLEFRHEIQSALSRLDYLNDPRAYDRQEELKAMTICVDALIRFSHRHAEKALSLSELEINPERKAELERIADICTNIPENPPRDFHEALQYYWFVHLGVTIELNTWDAFDPGRLDQHLYPFYRKGIEKGSLTRETAEELLQCFWIKFNNQPAPPKVGVTAAESGTYTDFAQINIGGMMPDGSDGVNDVSYLLLDVIEDMRLLQPSSSVQISKKNPDRFVKRAAKIIRTGFGQPSLFNADLIVQELVRQGKSLDDARRGGSSGCVEVGAFGKESYTLTGYFNMPKVFEITLHNGKDPMTGKKIGIETGSPEQFADFDEVLIEHRNGQAKREADIHNIPRAHRHYIPGLMWHITHRCHKSLCSAYDRHRVQQP